MADTLLIRLAPDLQGLRDWLLVDLQGQVKTPVQSGAPTSAVVSGARRVVVLVPGAEVSLYEARVPGRNRQRVLRAIPFALEEQLADDVEMLHFALGDSLGTDRYPVAVVERQRMDAWLAQLREAGISAHQWVPDTLALPRTDGWSLLPEADAVLVRSGDYSGFACDTETLPVLVSMMAAREQLPETARVYGSVVVDLEGVDVELDDSQLQPLDVLARGWFAGPVIDLLQGAYSRREEWGRLLRPWKATAALLIAALLLAGTSTGLNYYHLTRQKTQLETDIQALYKKTFPKARRIVNPRAQMEQQLKQLQRHTGGSTDFLGMFAETANAVRTAKGITVKGASYRDGRLDLDLQADNLQLLDTLKQALVSGGGMHAEIQSATTDDSKKINSRIRIKVKDS
ncbi:type II secretion system protein GspL [Pseudomonadota bacterium]